MKDSSSSGLDDQTLYQMTRKLLWLHAKCWFLHYCDYFGNQSKQTKFWRVTVAVIHHFSDGPRLPSDCQQRLRGRRLDTFGASHWSKHSRHWPLIGWIGLILSRVSAVITKQENWQIQWEFHRETGVKKDVTMRELRDKCSIAVSKF